MHIAVIDDGINVGYYPNVNKLSHDLEVTDELEIAEHTPEDGVRSHGTNCAAIIKKYAPTAQLVSIRVIDENPRNIAAKLVAALEWCLEHEVRIINLSVSVSLLSDYELIQPIIARLIKQDFVIIAALPNDIKYSVVADIFGVIRVREDRNLKDKSYYVGNNHILDADFYAASNHSLATQGPELLPPCPMHGNCYAAPLITAFVYEIIERHYSYNINFIKQKLAENIGIKGHNFNRYLLPNFADELVCFGFSQRNLDGIIYSGEFYDDFSYTLTERKYVLINAVVFTEEELKRFLVKSSHLIAGIIYTGYAPKWLSRFCLKTYIFLWDESVVKKHDIPFQAPVPDKKTPIIFVNSKMGFHFAKELCTCFSKKDSPALCVSDKALSYLYDILFFPQLDQNLINEICNLYSLSVLIVCADKLESDITAVAFVEESDTNIEVKIGDNIAQNFAKSVEMSEICDYIISVFGE